MSGSLRYGLAHLFRLVHRAKFTPRFFCSSRHSSRGNRIRINEELRLLGLWLRVGSRAEIHFLGGGLLSLSGKCTGHRHPKQSAGKKQGSAGGDFTRSKREKSAQQRVIRKKRVSLRSEITAYIIREHPTMIFKQDIIRFFDAEAEAARQKHEELMRLPIGERIRKRKAIDRLRLDPSFEGRSSERDVLWKLRVERNLADFKEGEQLMLHRADEAGGIQCVLYEFTAEDDLVVAIYPSNLYGVDTKTFVDVDLILDKALVDMRQVVCTNFYGALTEEESAWREMLPNHPTPPRFADRAACERELDDTLRNYELSCTPRQREAILRSMSAEDYYLIQGPPGTGKSFILAVIILEELLYFNRKVVLVGPNHLAINNALKQVLKLAPGIAERIVKVGALYNARDLSITIDDQPITTARIPRLNVSAVNRFEDYLLMGLTPYTLFTSRADRKSVV